MCEDVAFGSRKRAVKKCFAFLHSPFSVHTSLVQCSSGPEIQTLPTWNRRGVENKRSVVGGGICILDDYKSGWVYALPSCASWSFRISRISYTSRPCVMHASASVSIVDTPQPMQCSPALIITGTREGYV